MPLRTLLCTVGRRLDPETGVIYHLTFKPPPTDDPALVQRLVRRADDTEETVGKRLATFHATIDPIKLHFGSCLSIIDADRSPATIANDIFTAVDDVSVVNIRDGDAAQIAAPREVAVEEEEEVANAVVGASLQYCTAETDQIVSDIDDSSDADAAYLNELHIGDKEVEEEDEDTCDVLDATDEDDGDGHADDEGEAADDAFDLLDDEGVLAGMYSKILLVRGSCVSFL